ncbi:MAG: hypothetical protein LBK99_00520 [Opitutaceae bacterium]|jgi:hypothetical protein|nr:hypothetical protein [Opitutaceae bacterium]
MQPHFSTHELITGSLSLSFADGNGTLTATEARSGNLLFQTPSAPLFCPVLDGTAPALALDFVQADARRLTLRYAATDADTPLPGLCVHIETPPNADAIDISCEFTPAKSCEINRLQLLPPGTELNFFDAHNYRNRHHTSATSPELPLGGKGCSTDTYSGDWQFTPHPGAMLLRAANTMLFLGALDLPAAFGLQFSATDYLLKHLYLDYGCEPHGMRLAAGEAWRSPRFRIFLRRRMEPEKIYAEFGTMLVSAGIIPNPRDKPRCAWWTEPLYCTWVDQVFAANATLPDSLREQADAAELPVVKQTPVTALDENLVERAAHIIERENLPVRTLLIDDGWQVARGQWEPHPKRFPDLRALVDRLHDRGFKVVVWWNWAEIQPEAAVEPEHLAGGGGWRNRYDKRARDYSNPSTQENYLKPLFKKLFSNAPGCYDLDGVKTDFLADKVHPDMPLHDPAWRGEENYILRVTRLFYSGMRRHKPDAIHIGGAGHYWLAEHIDVNRTYDVHNSNWREHEERAKMLAATAPGVPVAYDFHNYTENLRHWFASARRLGASVEIGNLLWQKTHRFAPVVPADSRYWQLLREELSRFPLPVQTEGNVTTVTPPCDSVVLV